jgi:hypothetical protein
LAIVINGIVGMRILITPPYSKLTESGPIPDISSPIIDRGRYLGMRYQFGSILALFISIQIDQTDPTEIESTGEDCIIYQTSDSFLMEQGLRPFNLGY